MDRRQRKIEKKRKKRELVHKQARALEASRPSLEERLLSLAARSPLGPCALSHGWDDETTPKLVTAVVTHVLPSGELLPAIALVDRTCLGVKNGFVAHLVSEAELAEFLDEIGLSHGGMEEAPPLVVKSLVFNAIDYARRLGFEPHPDFPLALFAPRPEALLATPWHARERPFYMAGLDDDVARIRARLTAAVGPEHFDFIAGSALADLPLTALRELADEAADEDSRQR
jgi:hypothetical protein